MAAKISYIHVSSPTPASSHVAKGGAKNAMAAHRRALVDTTYEQHTSTEYNRAVREESQGSSHWKTTR